MQSPADDSGSSSNTFLNYIFSPYSLVYNQQQRSVPKKKMNKKDYQMYYTIRAYSTGFFHRSVAS